MKLSKEILKLTDEHPIKLNQLPEIELKQGSLKSIPEYIKNKNFKHIVLITDANTEEAAGARLKEEIIKAGLQATIIQLISNHHGQVNADETSLMQVMVETPVDSDALIAVGAGTIHDITRFCSEKLSIPFISVPTAASVDGFTSKGAPLILRGKKQTIQTCSPIAVFADTEILSKAPMALTAAGFGDILGKFTSLLDWRISHLVANEPYNATAAQITINSLEKCINYADEIAKSSEEGILLLMEALIESGLVMLILNFSRPASGGEHHLSHYWEMDLLKNDAPQLLHGAKVGVATCIIIDLYKKWSETINLGLLSKEDTYTENLREHWKEIKQEIDQLPEAQWLRLTLEQVGAPSIEGLNISEELVKRSLNEAWKLRDRCTGLFLINRYKENEISFSVHSPFLEK
ncbi:sn-glycerol-1-phosphate dehydrogenase [Halobacillus massiliensis]|uniref:sn-glycerol-1-phosphate dehydrogenase n=1 Tax=Halobacillus massiliensis TaxID=1926286 RepID=UPI0009E20FE5|nr:sn-glycerol-1-phosphate dehydrogenase [Halobacillus massiliensis]